MQIREKQKFFSLRPPARQRREISGWVQWVKWCPHIGQQMHCWQSVAAGSFLPCFACPKLGDAAKTRVASKNPNRRGTFYKSVFLKAIKVFGRKMCFMRNQASAEPNNELITSIVLCPILNSASCSLCLCEIKMKNWMFWESSFYFPL